MITTVALQSARRALAIGVVGGMVAACSSGSSSTNVSAKPHSSVPAGCIDLEALPRCSAVTGWCSADSVLVDPDGLEPVAPVAMHGLAADDAWFGVGSALMHWDGSAFSLAYRDPEARPVRDVFEAAPRDVWIAVGERDASAIVRVHGASSESPGAPLGASGIAGHGSSDVWVVGSGGGAHWDGSAFTPYPYGTPLFDVAVAGTQIWALASRPNPPVSCSPFPCPSSPPFYSTGDLVRFDGTTWGPTADTLRWNAEPDAPPPDAFVALGPDELWSVDGKIGGSAWSQPSTQGLGVGGASDEDVWRVGVGSSLLHWNGSVESTVPTPTTATLHSIWIAADGQGFVADTHGGVYRRSGDGFEPSTGALDTMGTGMAAIWGASDHEIYAVGRNVVRWDGCRWSTFEPFGASDPIAPLWLSPASDNPTWPTAAVWGIGDDLWITGLQGTSDSRMVIAHRDAAGWHRVEAPELARYFSIWGSAPNDVWFAGDFIDTGLRGLPATFLHWDGAALSPVTLPTDVAPTAGHLTSVTGTAQDDVWAIESSGAPGAGGLFPSCTVLHFDGAAWSRAPTPQTYTLTPPQQPECPGALRAVARNDVWAATRHGPYHFDGTRWVNLDNRGTVYTTSPTSIWVNAPDDVWFGDRLHWDGKVLLEPSAWSDLRGISLWGDGQRVWAAGRGNAITVHAR